MNVISSKNSPIVNSSFTYVRKKVPTKPQISNTNTGTPNHNATDSSSISNISFLNNNNYSNFIDNYEIPNIQELPSISNNSKLKQEEQKVCKHNERTNSSLNLGDIPFNENQQEDIDNDNNNNSINFNNNNNTHEMAKNVSNFSFKNVFPEKRDQKHKNKNNSMKNIFEDSKSDYSAIRNFSPKRAKQTFITVTEYDDLTPIPQRRTSIRHNFNEHDYKQAKSAAILIRRLEYSYNLRITRQYRIYEREIIYIQRFWRKYLKQKNENMLKALIDEETMRLKRENEIVEFLNAVCSTYYHYRKREMFALLKMNNAKLKKENFYSSKANVIIRAYRDHIKRKNKKILRRLKGKLNFFSKKKYKLLLLKAAREYRKCLNKVIFVQRYIKAYLMRKNENYMLYLGREVHPYIYYKMKYRNEEEEKMRKIKNFMWLIKKWKKFNKAKREDRLKDFIDMLTKFFYKQYFTIFITQLAKIINSELVYILLKPHFQSIEWIYYKSKLLKPFYIWKKDNTLKRKNEILGGNLVKKIVTFYGFKPIIKKLKKLKFLKGLLTKIITVTSKKIKFIKKNIIEKFKFISNVKNHSIFELQKINLRHFILKIQYFKFFYHFSIWKNKAHSMKSIINYKRRAKKKELNLLIQAKRRKNNSLIIKYFYRWRKQLYLLLNFHTKARFFIHYLRNIFKRYCREIYFVQFNIYHNIFIQKDLIHNAYLTKQEKDYQTIKFYFTEWKIAIERRIKVEKVQKLQRNYRRHLKDLKKQSVESEAS